MQVKCIFLSFSLLVRMRGLNEFAGTPYHHDRRDRRFAKMTRRLTAVDRFRSGGSHDAKNRRVNNAIFYTTLQYDLTSCGRRDHFHRLHRSIKKIIHYIVK